MGLKCNTADYFHCVKNSLHKLTDDKGVTFYFCSENEKLASSFFKFVVCIQFQSSLPIDFLDSCWFIAAFY